MIFRLANRPLSQLSRKPAARLRTVGSRARNGVPMTSRRMNSAPPPPPYHSHAAPVGRTRKKQNTRFSTYSAVSFASSTAKALTGMDSSRSASRPPKTTPWAAKTVNTSPAITAMAGIISRRSSRTPAAASCPPREKL